jgi:hypothetical protein
MEGNFFFFEKIFVGPLVAFVQLTVIENAAK